MPGLLPDIDPDGLLEYSVVYTDRALNHMSQAFQQVMRDISDLLREVYSADAVAIVPGSGTFGMEAVARQFATGKRCLVIRNGWFSYRWSQIFEMGNIPGDSVVLQARQLEDAPQSPFIPCPVEEVVREIHDYRPDVVFAPHVETSAGMMLPEEYIQALAEATHDVGGMLVIDSIASGAVWLDMKRCGIDVLLSAPQKGWSASPCAGLVMLSERALERTRNTTSTSFACDLGKWLQIMEAYEKGGHAYHATMPTDGLKRFRDIMLEIREFGFAEAMERQLELGTGMRQLLEQSGYPSVAAEGFQAPGVIVSYTDDPDLKNASRFMEEGIQIAAGVPLQCDERSDFSTFRIGLFGLDKLQDTERTLQTFNQALTRIRQT